jgi:hypothetical protein
MRLAAWITMGENDRTHEDMVNGRRAQVRQRPLGMLRLIRRFGRWTTSALLAAFAYPSVALAQAAEPLRAELVGSWSWTLPDGKCTESHTYRADGTRFVVSGAEKSESTYVVEQVPNSRFRKLTITTVKDYRGKDCGGSDEDDTGQTWTVYYLISPERNQVLFCCQPSLQECYGPFHKGSGA